MSYEVIEPFKDREDGLYLYDTAGTAYPREGFDPSEEWLEALASANNRAKRPFIKKVEGTTDTEDESTEDQISAEIVEETIEADDEKKSLEDFTVEELKGFLDDLEVKYTTRATKPQLIKLLEAEVAKED